MVHVSVQAIRDYLRCVHTDSQRRWKSENEIQNILAASFKKQHEGLTFDGDEVYDLELEVYNWENYLGTYHIVVRKSLRGKFEEPNIIALYDLQ